MKGFGSYHDWDYYASPHSNLSAFAAPFSVNRPTLSDVSAPFFDSADAAPPNPVHSQSYGYDDFFSDSVREKPYGYSGLQVPHHDAFSYDQRPNSTKPSFVEAPPYFPSYISPTNHSPTSSVAPNYWSSSSGFDGPSLGDYADKSHELGFADQGAVTWNQFAEFNHGKGKQVGAGSSFCSMQTGSVVEERMNQGCQVMKESNNDEVLHMTDWKKHSVPIGADQLDDKRSWWEAIKPMPVEFSGTSVMQSPSLSLETHHEAPSKLGADTGSFRLSYTSPYDKHSRQLDKPSRVDTVSSTPTTRLVTDLTGNILAVGDFGHNSLYNIKDAYHTPSPGTAGCFDLGHLRMHLDRNEPSSSNNAMISDEDFPKDVADYVKARHGFQNPPNLDNLSLCLDPVIDLNSVEKSFEHGDQRNPAVDSPCWKGVFAAHSSHYKSSEALPPEYEHKNAECFGSVIQETKSFLLDTVNNVKKSCENSNSSQMHTEIVNQETTSAGPLRKFSVTKLASKDCKSDGAVNAGPFQSEPSYDYGLQYLDDITEMKENSIPPTKPIDGEIGSSHTEHLVTEENKLMSQRQNTLCIGGADTGYNVNKCLESGTSHTTEHALSSPSSVVDAPTPPKKSAGKVSTEKLNAQMLVDTMQNLSELLLYHCLNDGCELKERDCNILKNVISNLNTCTLKNAEQTTPAQECLLHQPETSRCAGESFELQQNASFKWPQLTKIRPESSKVDDKNLLVQEANLHFRSGKPNWKLSDSISARGDAESTKADNMTKALKRILSDNFHDDDEEESQTVLYKNLWLEAEAALCSMYYRARYRQMKIEMEKHSYKQSDMEEQSKPEVIVPSQSSATEVHNYPDPDFSAQDLPASHATNPEERSLYSFLQHFTNSSTNKGVSENDEASVMARYQVLKNRVDKPCLNTTNLEEPSDKLAPRERENQNQVNFCQDSPNPGINKADHEASVVARFHILKSRVEDSSSISSEEKLLDGVGFSGKGIDDTSITENASEGKSLGVDLNSYTAVEKSIPKEFHLDLEDNQQIHPCGNYESQLSTYYSDGLASDWEHVE